MILVRNTGRSSFQFNNIRLIKSHIMHLSLFGVHVVDKAIWNRKKYGPIHRLRAQAYLSLVLSLLSETHLILFLLAFKLKSM